MKIAQAVKPICPSPIGWLGGKTKLRTTIISCMPEHSSYIEVFCGSATVYFGKPRSSQELINDIHEELILLFKVLAEQFGQAVLHEFVNYVRSMPSARVAHEEWKHFGPKELAKLNPAQRAFRFYYCTKRIQLHRQRRVFSLTAFTVPVQYEYGLREIHR